MSRDRAASGPIDNCLDRVSLMLSKIDGLAHRHVPRMPYMNAGMAADHSPAIGESFARPLA